MIEFLEGRVSGKNPTQVVLNVNGIGYLLSISLHTYEKLADKEQVRLLAHQVIREDEHALFGFYDEEERTLFRHLISISGVGPNTARTMLSGLPPRELRHAIISGDASLLKAVKGIGPKSAQRIIVELQDVLKKTATEDVSFVSQRSHKAEEALAAMVALGFGRPLAEKAISRILREQKEDDLSVEDLIKQALRMI